MDKNRELVSLIMDISKALRCCHQDSVICEYVTFFQFYILDAIAVKGRLKLAELHTILAVEKSTTTRLVDPLVKQGLVAREKSHDDSRAVLLTLTSKGQQVHEKVWTCIGGFIRSMEETIPGNKREQVYDSVRIFAAALKIACHAEHCQE